MFSVRKGIYFSRLEKHEKVPRLQGIEKDKRLKNNITMPTYISMTQSQKDFLCEILLKDINKNLKSGDSISLSKRKTSIKFLVSIKIIELITKGEKYDIQTKTTTTANS